MRRYGSSLGKSSNEGCGVSRKKGARFENSSPVFGRPGGLGRGVLRPSRTAVLRPEDVKAVRAELSASQAEFALTIGVSVAPLRNWEQERRTPDGPALAPLRVAAKSLEPSRPLFLVILSLWCGSSGTSLNRIEGQR